VGPLDIGEDQCGAPVAPRPARTMPSPPRRGTTKIQVRSAVSSARQPVDCQLQLRTVRPLLRINYVEARGGPWLPALQNGTPRVGQAARWVGGCSLRDGATRERPRKGVRATSALAACRSTRREVPRRRRHPRHAANRRLVCLRPPPRSAPRPHTRRPSSAPRCPQRGRAFQAGSRWPVATEPLPRRPRPVAALTAPRTRVAIGVAGGTDLGAPRRAPPGAAGARRPPLSTGGAGGGVVAHQRRRPAAGHVAAVRADRLCVGRGAGTGAPRRARASGAVQGEGRGVARGAR